VGFNKILSIKASINLGLTDKLKLAFPEILAIEKPLATRMEDVKIQDSNWISGFTSRKAKVMVVFMFLYLNLLLLKQGI
jgi:hypothetical protein